MVLGDVPCSGTGTLGRNPEIRHRLRPEDLPRQAERQQAIFRAGIARRSSRRARGLLHVFSGEGRKRRCGRSGAHRESRSTSCVSRSARSKNFVREGFLTSAGAERLHRCIPAEGHLRLLAGRVPHRWILRGDAAKVGLIDSPNGVVCAEVWAPTRAPASVSVVSPEHGAKRFDHQFMIGAHRQAGHRHAADDARARHAQRKRSTMRRIVGERQALALKERLAFCFSCSPTA